MDIFSEKDVKGVQAVIENETALKDQGPNVAQTKAKDEVAELNLQSQRIQDLIDQIDTLPNSDARKLMQDCIQEILGFYGQGLQRIMQYVTMGDKDENGSLLKSLTDDSFISGLLLIHDLHPLSLETRLSLALEKVKPYMDSHGGSVEITSLENGVAKLNLLGSCKGCPSSAMTLELGIKEAIEEYCPDLEGLEVDGLSSRAKSQKETQKSDKGWKVVPGLTDLPNGGMKPILDGSGTLLIICRVDDKYYAYKNLCPACDRPFTNGRLEKEVLYCKLGHGYDLQKAGECTNSPDLRLIPFPLVVEDGLIKISIG